MVIQQMEHLQAQEGWQKAVEGCYSHNLNHHPHHVAAAILSTLQCLFRRIHKYKSKMDDLHTNPKVSKIELSVRLSTTTLGWAAWHAETAHAAQPSDQQAEYKKDGT